jgi:hypothetical protein
MLVWLDSTFLLSASAWLASARAEPAALTLIVKGSFFTASDASIKSLTSATCTVHRRRAVP